MASVLNTSVEGKGEDDIVAWLTQIGLSKYVKKFTDDEITKDDLLLLENESEIDQFIKNEMGIKKMIHQKKLKKEILKLQNGIDDKIIVISKNEENVIKQIKNLLNDIVKIIKKNENYSNDINNKTINARNKLNNYFNNLINELKQRQNKLLNELNTIKNNKIKKCNTNANILLNYKKIVAEKQNELNKLIKKSNRNENDIKNSYNALRDCNDYKLFNDIKKKIIDKRNN